jgi:hypothetical protein
MRPEDFSVGVLGDKAENSPYESFIREFGKHMISYMNENPTADPGEIFELLHEIIKTCTVAEKNQDKIAKLAQADEKLAKELEEIHDMVTRKNKSDD